MARDPMSQFFLLQVIFPNVEPCTQNIYKYYRRREISDSKKKRERQRQDKEEEQKKQNS
jgi:hypothetical protein